MNHNYNQSHYVTQSTSDKQEGYAGLELFQTINGNTKRVARVIFWDASGQFFLETFNVELPVAIVEELIAETKAAVKIG